MVSFKGLARLLFFTHNTMLSVLYTLLRGPNAHFIRAVDERGVIINRGAQFRYGIDSQYGDVVFVMKNDFWRGLKGTGEHGRNVTQHVHFGHFYKHDFVEYKGEANQFLVKRWLELEAMAFDYRPETYGLNGKECKQREWNVTWCNLQVHVGENIDFHHIEKVYAPAWIVHDSETMAKISANGLNITVLLQAVTNQLPYYPDNQTVPEVNLLNGKFHLYGPKRASDHYHKIEKAHSRYRYRQHTGAIYTAIEPTNVAYSVQTHRHRSSSSAISLSEVAFLDLQSKYITDLVAYNMTVKDPSQQAAEGHEDSRQRRAHLIYRHL